MMQELNYIRCGDYYIPDIRLPEENRPIGRWGRMHRDYIKEHNPIRFNDLCLSGELWTCAKAGCGPKYLAFKATETSSVSKPSSGRGRLQS